MGLHPTRIARIQQQLQQAELAALAVLPGPNMQYLTGLEFHLSERATLCFVPASGAPLLVVPALEQTKAQSAGCEIFTFTDEAGPLQAATAALQALALRGPRLGIEGRRMRFLELDLLARAGLQAQPTDADAVLATLRMCKDAGELQAMRTAVAVAQRAMLATLPAIRPGISERELASELTVQLLRAGADANIPFSPIVASGPNGANPHAFPTGRALQAGDFVTLDWGCSHENYVADLTRTYALAGAQLQPQLERAYAAVLAANAAGRAAARPGTTGHAVDRAARAQIEAAGLGDYFIHRTGHGLGLEVHEEPDMKQGEQLPLEPGMTFTIEPGVYLPGIGGVRIEDNMVITATGAESLTTLARELVPLA